MNPIAPARMAPAPESCIHTGRLQIHAQLDTSQSGILKRLSEPGFCFMTVFSLDDFGGYFDVFTASVSGAGLRPEAGMVKGGTVGVLTLVVPEARLSNSMFAMRFPSRIA